jgi:hypothetical protein
MAELWQRGKITLVWSEGHDLHGLEIVMRRRALGEIIQGWQEEGNDDRPWSEMSGPEKAAQARRNAAYLAGLIVSWNLAGDDGAPVAPTVEGLLRACDDDMIADMRTAYLEATLRVAPPLPASSDAGPVPAPPELESGVPEEWAAAMPPHEVLTS